MNIFTYSDYKKYLKDWISARPKRGHGLRAQIAKLVGCNTTYVTQVLSGAAHFSMEQAERLLAFLSLDGKETTYFLTLVLHERAGTRSLKKYFRKQLDEAINENLSFKNRIQEKRSLDEKDQATYYSVWYYAAIHVSLAIPELQNLTKLASYFGLTPAKVSSVLKFLVSVGLIEERGSWYGTGPVRLHLPKDSPNIFKHHTNWRIKAIDLLDRMRPDELRYSSVITISKSDEQRARFILTKAIEEIRSIVRDSQDEEVCVYTVDFFNLRHDQ